MEKSVKVLRSTSLFDFVEITTKDNIAVITGEVVEKKGDQLILKLADKDAICVNDWAILWWDYQRKLFVQQ
jgi:hypothetical protein